jgi:small subunit ribosomal protein S16
LAKISLAKAEGRRLPSRLFFETGTQLIGRLQTCCRAAAGTVFDQETIFMAVKIRMKRVGARNTPVFRIVVADGRSPRDGKCIEEIGTYQPRKKGDNVVLKQDRVDYWLSKGAQPSDTVASFIRKARRAAAVVPA